MADFQIRQFFYPDDYPGVIDLWSKGGSGIHISPSDTPDEIQKKLSRDPDLFLVAISNNSIIGTVLGGYDGRRGLIYHLVTQTESRNKGVGSSLMVELEKRLKSKGCIRCYLLVTPENEVAMQFYISRGWEKMTIIPFAKNL